MLLFFIVCASISLTLAAPENRIYSLEEGRELFETFISEYNKKYEGKEKEERLQIFLDNLKEINSLNEKSSSAVYGITQFSDLTKDEFIKTYTGFKVEKNLLDRKNSDYVLETFNYTAPKEFDWRSKGVVSRVKDQGRCGACWAFGATGNVESLNAIKTGNIVEISEQQIVDCDKVSHGCSPGYPDQAITYLIKKGAMSEKSYPYHAKEGSCAFDKSKVVIHPVNVTHLQITEQDIKEKLFKNGPLIIIIDARPLFNYRGGIIAEGCSTKQLNHAVLLVGYGQEKGVDYWLVKNSWAESFGEKGYFKMQRGINCLNINAYGVVTAVM